MGLSNRWGAPVGNLIAGGILVVAILFTLAIVLLGIGAVLRAWAYLMGA